LLAGKELKALIAETEFMEILSNSISIEERVLHHFFVVQLLILDYMGTPMEFYEK